MFGAGGPFAGNADSNPSSSGSQANADGPIDAEVV